MLHFLLGHHEADKRCLVGITDCLDVHCGPEYLIVPATLCCQPAIGAVFSVAYAARKMQMSCGCTALVASGAATCATISGSSCSVGICSLITAWLMLLHQKN